MKYITLFLFSFFFIFKSLGQNISPTEMVKLSSVNKETFDSYMQKIGYKLKKATDNEEGLYASYIYRRKNIVKFCSHREEMNDKISIVFETNNATDYKYSKEAIKTLGFKLFKTKTLGDGALVFHFRKKKNIFALTSWVEDGVNFYEIAFEKKVVFH